MQVRVRVRVKVVRRVRRTPQQPFRGGEEGPRIQLVAAMEKHNEKENIKAKTEK